MAKSKPKSKLTRKQLLKKDDAFLSAASQGAKWVLSNRTQVIVGSVAVLAVILGTWGVVEYFRARDQDASVLFDRATTILDGTVFPEGSTEVPEPDAEKPTFATEAGKWQAARDKFEEIIEKASGSRVATLARFYVGDLSVKLGDDERAEKEFMALVDSMSPSDSLFFLAVERAAYLQEGRGDLAMAVKTLGRLVNVERGFYGDFATYHQARLYLAQGESERARQLFQRIENEYPDSPVAERVKERLAVMGPAPGAGPAQNNAPVDELDADQTGSAVESDIQTEQLVQEPAAGEAAGTASSTQKDEP